MSSTYESLQVLPQNNETIHRKNGCLEAISSYNRFFLIYACLKPRRYHNWYLYLLPTIFVLEKRNKFDRISGCNYSFTIEKGQLIEWMAKIGLAYYKRIHCVKSVGIQSYSGPLFPAFRLNTEICRGKSGPE